MRKFEIGDDVVFTVGHIKDISHNADGFTLGRTYEVDNVEYREDYINIDLTNDNGYPQTVKSTDLRHADDDTSYAEKECRDTVLEPVKVSLDKVGNLCKLTIDGRLSREQIDSILAVVYCDE